MKLPLSTIAFTCALVAFSACCKKETPGDPEPPTTYQGNPIRFDSLAVGQTTHHIALEGKQYNSGQTNQFTYSDDSLQLSIIAQDAHGFLVAESMRYSGAVSEWLNYYKDSVLYYYLTVVDDTLRIKKPGSTFLYSQIFHYQIAMQGLPLSKFSNQSLTIEGWKTSLPYCECRRTGYVEQYSLFGASYPFLNVLVENSAMSLDGNGETYVYDARTGLVRSSTYSWWTSDGYGWDLLTVE